MLLQLPQVFLLCPMRPPPSNPHSLRQSPHQVYSFVRGHVLYRVFTTWSLVPFRHHIFYPFYPLHLPRAQHFSWYYWLPLVYCTSYSFTLCTVRLSPWKHELHGGRIFRCTHWPLRPAARNGSGSPIACSGRAARTHRSLPGLRSAETSGSAPCALPGNFSACNSFRKTHIYRVSQL